MPHRIALAALAVAALALAVPFGTADAAKKAHGAKKPGEKSAAKADTHYPALALADQACTPDGAFGRRFLRDRNGTTDTTVDDAWAPFGRLTIRYNEIRAEADFRGATDSPEEDVAAAKKFLKAFEKSQHHFAHHITHTNGTEFDSSEHGDVGMSFLIRQDDEQVVATCLSRDR